MKRGRPSTYNSARAVQIITIMRKGYSVTAAAGAMNVHRDTIYHWARTRADFLEAFEIAKAMRVFKLEADLLVAEDAVSVRRCITALKSACPEEWNTARRSQRRSSQ